MDNKGMSIESLTNDRYEFEIKDPEFDKEGRESTEKPTDGVRHALQTLRDSKLAKTVFGLSVHLVFVVYFSYATKYFLNYSYVHINQTCCDGFGFLLIIFVVSNYFVAHRIVLKPYLYPVLNKLLLKPISRGLNKCLSQKFVRPILALLVLASILGYLIYDTQDDRRRLVPLSGLSVFLLIGVVFSKYPKQINWSPVFWGLLLQFGFGLFTLRWEVGRNIFGCLGNKTTDLLGYAVDGAAFVYGDMLVKKEGVFAFQALSTIFFLSFMVNILYHFGIMQTVVGELGGLLHAVMGTSICESVNSAANIFLGMTEAPLILSPYLKSLTNSELHSIMASGFATVSGTVLAAYISFGASASHLITASVMSAPAALCLSKLLYPETESVALTKKEIALTKSEYSSALSAASDGASKAVAMVMGIISNIIAFVSFVYFCNGVLAWLGHLIGYKGEDAWTVELLLGYCFMPISYIMGVPWTECQAVGRLIGIKTIINEFAAFKEMNAIELKPKTRVIATYALAGFSNIGSVGIMISGLGTLVPGKKRVITDLVFRALVCGSMVCFMTACIAALLIPE